MSSKPVQLGLFSSDDDTTRVLKRSHKQSKPIKNAGQKMLFSQDQIFDAFRPRRTTGLHEAIPLQLESQKVATGERTRPFDLGIEFDTQEVLTRIHNVTVKIILSQDDIDMQLNASCLVPLLLQVACELTLNPAIQGVDEHALKALWGGTRKAQKKFGAQPAHRRSNYLDRIRKSVNKNR